MFYSSLLSFQCWFVVDDTSPVVYSLDYTSAPTSTLVAAFTNITSRSMDAMLFLKIQPETGDGWQGSIGHSFSGTFLFFWCWRFVDDFSDTDWITFFSYYTPFVKQHAELAEQYGVKYLVIGEDLWYSVRNFIFDSIINNWIQHPQESLWTDLITQVRSVFTGKITYFCQRTDYNWVNQLDFLHPNSFAIDFKRGKKTNRIIYT